MTQQKQIVGVSFGDGSTVPSVILKGTGEMAEAVLRSALNGEHPHVVRDAALVKQLYRVPIDTPVGKQLFPAVALLLTRILEIDSDGKRSER